MMQNHEPDIFSSVQNLFCTVHCVPVFLASGLHAMCSQSQFLDSRMRNILDQVCFLDIRHPGLHARYKLSRGTQPIYSESVSVSFCRVSCPRVVGNTFTFSNTARKKLHMSYGYPFSVMVVTQYATRPIPRSCLTVENRCNSQRAHASISLFFIIITKCSLSFLFADSSASDFEFNQLMIFCEDANNEQCIKSLSEQIKIYLN